MQKCLIIFFMLFFFFFCKKNTGFPLEHISKFKLRRKIMVKFTQSCSDARMIKSNKF